MAGPPAGNEATPMAGSGFALITGASRGIGACFARAIAARGRNIVLVARSKDKLEALKAEITATHPVQVVTIAQDLSTEGAPRRIVDELAERGVTVDLLVNNAGFGAHGRFW